MLRSRYVYQRSIVNDLADLLASLRAQCTTQAGQQMPDQIIVGFMDVAFDHDPSFDTERFASRARLYFDPITSSDPTTQPQGD